MLYCSELSANEMRQLIKSVKSLLHILLISFVVKNIIIHTYMHIIANAPVTADAAAIQYFI